MSSQVVDWKLGGGLSSLVILFCACNETKPKGTGVPSRDVARVSADRVVEAAGATYTTPSERNQAIISALRESGLPSDEVAGVGEQFRKGLAAAELTAGPPGCYRAGCYFLLLGFDEQTVVKIRDETASGYSMLVTPDAPPTKMLLLLKHERTEMKEQQ